MLGTWTPFHLWIPYHPWQAGGTRLRPTARSGGGWLNVEEGTQGGQVAPFPCLPWGHAPSNAPEPGCPQRRDQCLRSMTCSPGPQSTRWGDNDEFWRMSSVFSEGAWGEDANYLSPSRMFKLSGSIHPFLYSINMYWTALYILVTVLGAGDIVVNKTENSKYRPFLPLGHPIKSWKMKQVENRPIIFPPIKRPQWKIWKGTSKIGSRSPETITVIFQGIFFCSSNMCVSSTIKTIQCLQGFNLLLL